MCKRIFRFELQLSCYWQNIKFSRNCSKSTILQISYLFKSIFATFLITCFNPIHFMDMMRDMSGILFFHFCQLWAVKGLNFDSKLLSLHTQGVSERGCAPSEAGKFRIFEKCGIWWILLHVIGAKKLMYFWNRIMKLVNTCAIWSTLKLKMLKSLTISENNGTFLLNFA